MIKKLQKSLLEKRPKERTFHTRAEKNDETIHGGKSITLLPPYRARKTNFRSGYYRKKHLQKFEKEHNF